MANTCTTFRFEFVRSIGSEIVPIKLQEGQELTGKVLKHISGTGPIYIRASKELIYDRVSYIE